MEEESKDIIADDLEPIYDTLSECILEIEELKSELTTIVMTQTSNSVGARERWDTPQVKGSNNKRGRLRKDRYSSLIMANSVARMINRTEGPTSYDVIGGTSDMSAMPNQDLYKGPQWFTNDANEDIYLGIYKK